MSTVALVLLQKSKTDLWLVQVVLWMPAVEVFGLVGRGGSRELLIDVWDEAAVVEVEEYPRIS